MAWFKKSREIKTDKKVKDPGRVVGEVRQL